MVNLTLMLISWMNWLKPMKKTGVQTVSPWNHGASERYFYTLMITICRKRKHGSNDPLILTERMPSLGTWAKTTPSMQTGSRRRETYKGRRSSSPRPSTSSGNAVPMVGWHEPKNPLQNLHDKFNAKLKKIALSFDLITDRKNPSLCFTQLKWKSILGAQTTIVGEHHDYHRRDPPIHLIQNTPYGKSHRYHTAPGH